MNEATINLISPYEKSGGPLAPFEGQLRVGSFVGLGIFIFSTVIVSLLYLFIHQQNVQLQAHRDQLKQQIAAQSAIEGLLVALQSRTTVAGKILAGQVNWANILTLVSQFVPPGTLGSISVDGKHRVAMTIKTSSIEANLPILGSVLGGVDAKQILSPQIVSFQLGADGTTTLVLSFLPVL